MISRQSSAEVFARGSVVVDDGSLHDQQRSKDKPTNQLERFTLYTQCVAYFTWYLYSSDGVSLNNISVDALDVVLDDTLIQVAQRVVETTDKTPVLHGLSIEAEKVVLTGLQDLGLCRGNRFVLGLGVGLNQLRLQTVIFGRKFCEV